jgi:hypothetical protein
MVAMGALDFNLLIGLVIAGISIGAYILVLRKMRAQPYSEETFEPSELNTEVSEKTETTVVAEAPEPSMQHEPLAEKPRMKCSHRFGYLGSLPRKADPPEECLQCTRIARCKNRKTVKKTKTKRTTILTAAIEEPEIET